MNPPLTNRRLLTALLLLIGTVGCWLAVSHFNRTANDSRKAITFPDIDTIEAKSETAGFDCDERIRRLRDGTDTVDDAMIRFAEHDFVGGTSFEELSGWAMTTESGTLLSRSVLQRQAAILESIGEDAVPALVKWLEHDQIEIRYIASFALEQITGLDPFFPTFASREELDEQGWLAQTRAEYEVWIRLNQKR